MCPVKAVSRLAPSLKLGYSRSYGYWKKPSPRGGNNESDLNIFWWEPRAELSVEGFDPDRREIGLREGSIVETPTPFVWLSRRPPPRPRRNRM